jgi:hypothetical protein
MSGKHTKGPWKVGWWGVCCRNPIHVAAERHPGPPECVYEPQFFEGTGIAGSEPGQMVIDARCDELVIQEADLDLIVSAPDLLDALKQLVNATRRADNPFDMGVSTDAPEMVAAHAVIAKVEGR